jgi:DNA-binding transcriptional ArsR family regulator
MEVNMKKNSKQLFEKCEIVSAVLKAISHPLRLRILCSLIEGEKSVSQLEIESGASQSSVSQYLSKMKSERLVTNRRQAQSVYYRIESHQLVQLMTSLQKIYCR